MLEGTHTMEAFEPPDRGLSQSPQYHVDAVAWGGTILEDPAKHSYGINFVVRAHNSATPLLEFSLPIASARELGVWLTNKADQLVA